MFRLIVSFSLLLFVAIVSIGGCNGGGNGDGMEPAPSPEPGFSCDFVPDEASTFYTEADCIGLANAFGCADFSFQGGICEVTGCEDCLCNATSQIAEGTIGPQGCSLAAALSNCFNAFFDEGTDECNLLVCVHEAPCGPFDEIIP